MQANQNSQYSEKELQEYRGCPEVKFVGSHVAGLRGCIYCAEIYRRYHKNELQRMAALKEQQQLEGGPEQENVEDPKQGTKSVVSNLRLEDDDDADGIKCNKLLCARAGWCMCQ